MHFALVLIAVFFCFLVRRQQLCAWISLYVYTCLMVICGFACYGSMFCKNLYSCYMLSIDLFFHQVSCHCKNIPCFLKELFSSLCRRAKYGHLDMGVNPDRKSGAESLRRLVLALQYLPATPAANLAPTVSACPFRWIQPARWRGGSCRLGIPGPPNHCPGLHPGEVTPVPPSAATQRGETAVTG